MVHNVGVGKHGALVEVEQCGDEIEKGQWYWVEGTVKEGRSYSLLPCEYANAPEGYHYLACVTDIGSNYVELKTPEDDRRSSYSWRVLIKDFHQKTIHVQNPSAEINSIIDRSRQGSAAAMAEIRKITANLGVGTALTHTTHAQSSSTELSTLTNLDAPKEYKTALVTAKTEILPVLFESVKKFTGITAKWMAAETLALQSSMGDMKAIVSRIEDRILNIDIYAGLSEECLLIQGGAPAHLNEKVHVFQRQLYMDEESLLDYDAGGMEFSAIEDFDAWLIRPDNLARLLPHPRSLVTFKIRREKKERRTDGTSIEKYIHFMMDKMDEQTFIYMRNGEQIYRLSSAIEFGELLFPSRDQHFNEPMAAKLFGSKVDSLMPVRELEHIKSQLASEKAKEDKWFADHPYDVWVENQKSVDPSDTSEYDWKRANPYTSEVSHLERKVDRYEIVDEDNAHFDEVMAIIDAKAKEFNRVATLLQGLFDRSIVFVPHQNLKINTMHGFDAMIKLMYDAELVLAHGEAPDFDAYVMRCNALADENSVFFGQEQAWISRETDKENNKRSNHRLSNHLGTTNWYVPVGLKGPGMLAQPYKFMPRAGKVMFRWDSTDYRIYSTRKIATITVPLSELLNISAYQKGDYKQFYQDHRTRAQYLKWAPLLLAAEDYVNGKGIVSAPCKD